MKSIDINCDMGEGVPNDPQLMPLISSCNIACGGHTGNANTIRATIRLALKYGVKIGAHPSYPDPENFGRKPMDITPRTLVKSIKTQLNTFMEVAQQEKATLHHIKPHGALYNQIAKDKDWAAVFLNALATYTDTPLYVPFGSAIHQLALTQKWPFKLEGFGDRNYLQNLTLVPRTSIAALLQQPEAVLTHILSIINHNKLRTLDGITKRFKADTICIHGDTPTALQILMYLNTQLPKHNIQIEK